MTRMKLTKEEYAFFAQHAPREFDLSRLSPEPCPENDAALTVDREAFIVMAGITDHVIAAPVDTKIINNTRDTSKVSQAMHVLIPVAACVLVVVIVLMVNEIYF